MRITPTTTRQARKMLLGLMRQYSTRMESLVSVGGQRYVRARVRRRYPEWLVGVLKGETKVWQIDIPRDIR